MSLAFVAACGGSTPPPAAPASTTPVGESAPMAPTPSATAAPSAPALATPPAASPEVWTEHMTKEEQVAFMKKNVNGRMNKVFSAHDGARYGSFGCKTCHGPAFKDPKDFLPKLTFKDGKITSFAEKPEISKFMAEHVVPEMASAMGLPPFDPQTHKGFGCGGCHAMDMR